MIASLLAQQQIRLQDKCTGQCAKAQGQEPADCIVACCFVLCAQHCGMQAQQNEGSLSKGQGLPSGPQNPEFRHLLAQFNPNGLFKQQVPGLKLEGFIPTHGVPGQDLASAVQLAQKSQSFAQLVSSRATAL